MAGEPGSAPEESALPPTGERTFSLHAIHLMRTAQMNGLTHARMADQKASILLGATFLVFSLSISRALAQDVPAALYVLAGFAFASALCAVMAVLPSVGHRSRQPAASRSNLLFFGDFAERDEADWTRELLTALETDERVFRTMAHDIYQNGQVLQRRKYRYLAAAYRLFVAGLFATLLVFAAEMLRAG